MAKDYGADPEALSQSRRFGYPEDPGHPEMKYKEDGTMSERNTDQKAREWADEIPDDEETERPEPYEETYRDGNAKHECWDGK